MEEVYEQLEKEQAKEIWKQGLERLLIAGAMLFMVFATKGMFSPMFLTTIGVPTATHQVCNGLEGVQDIYYGLKGDIYTASYNPYVEAYKYLGLPEEAYYINDMLLSGTYAVMVPLNQFSAASISGGNIALARWSVCQDVAIDLGTDWTVSHICELCGADDYVATLAGLSIGTMAGFGGKYDINVSYISNVDLPNNKYIGGNEKMNIDSVLGKYNLNNTQDVWKLPPIERGKVLEELLAYSDYDDWWNCGAENGGYYPVVDFSLGDNVVSLKTIDPSLPSYQNGKADEMIVAYINTLSSYNITIDGRVANKILDVRIPEGTINMIDCNMLQEVALNEGITLTITEY